MISLLLLAAVVCGANAAAIGAMDQSCAYGEWSEWSQCFSSRHCPAPLYHTQKMAETAEWDEGRSAMMKLMKDKRDAWSARDECKADGSCTEVFKLPLNGDYVCNENGLAGDIPCDSVNQLSFLTFQQMGYSTGNPAGNDVWGWTDPQTGKEYAIMGFNGGTSFVDISNPKAPVPLAFMYSTGNTVSSWRDIKVIGNYAFIVSEASNHGLQVMDLTRLRAFTGATIVVVQPDAVNNDFGQAHNIVSNSDTNYVFVVGSRNGNYPRLCAGGLMAINVQNPLQPTFAGCYGGDGYVHDAHCLIYHGPDTRYTGREICFCFNENSFTIVDATNKAAMVMITKSSYPNVAYTHQGWATEDHTHIIMDDEQDEANKPNQYTKTYVWNVETLDNPILRKIYQAPVTSIDHNQYIIGNLVYQANYESGLRVLYFDQDAAELYQVGFFDVFPSRTTAQYYGTWSVYPFFGSSSVALSSIDYGLFIVELDMVAIQEKIDNIKRGVISTEQTRTRKSSGSMCPAVRESQSCPTPTIC